MAYVATLYEACSVRMAIKAKFLSSEEDSLVIAKSSHIEIYKITSTSIILETKFPVYGRIVAIEAFRPEKSPTDYLFIVIGQVKFHYFSISWDPVAKKPKDEQVAIDITDYYNQLSESFICVADPESSMLALQAYQGSFVAIPQVQKLVKGPRSTTSSGPDRGNIRDPTIVHLKELEVIDLKFLFGTKLPVLAVLHRAYHGGLLAVNTYEVTVRAGDVVLSDWIIHDPRAGQEALFLVPIQMPVGGLLIVGATKLQYISNSGERTFEPVDNSRDWTSWEIISPGRYILGDSVGGLYLVTIKLERRGMKYCLRLRKIGDASIPEIFVNLGNGLLYLGSHFGDSQLLKIHENNDTYQVEVLQIFDNIGPMIDFKVMDSDYSRTLEGTRQYSAGHVRFLSASGGHKQGRLRNIRSGVGLDDLGVLGEMTDIRGLWGLRSIPENSYDDVLVVTFVEETRIFKFGEVGDIEELDEFMGFSLDQRTVIAHNVIGGRLLQVTSTAIRLVEPDSGTVIAEGCPDDGNTITMACANHELLIYAMGPTLVLLNLAQDLKEHHRKTFDNEISCLNIPAAPSKICAVGFWSVSSVLILSVEDFSILAQDVLSGEGSVASPRSLLLTRILENGPPSLLVALGDGSMFTFAMDEETCALYEKKNIILGTQPISFQPILGGDGKMTVFATCDHPSVIRGIDGRIVYSSVTADKSTYVTSFNSANFPNAVVIASEDDLKLAVVDPLRTMHIQSVPVGDVVRRIAYLKGRDLVAVITVKHELKAESGDDVITSYVRLIDNNTFSMVDSYQLEELELAESIASGSLCNESGSFSEAILAGTSYVSAAEDTSEKGRISIFSVSETKCLKLVAAHNTVGAVKGIRVMGEGKFLVAAGKMIELLTLEYSEHQSKTPTGNKPNAAGFAIVKLASLGTHTSPLDFAVYNDMIAVCDIMQGPSVFQYKENETTKKIEFVEMARSYKPSWMTALELLDENTILSTDSSGNMIIWERQVSGVTEEDRKQLRSISSLKIREYVNRIGRISDQTLAGSKVQPKAYLSTIEGSMYLVGEIAPSNVDLLMKLQTNLAKVCKGLGDIDFLESRGTSTSLFDINPEPVRFVDGDFLETFLDLPLDVAEAVVEGHGKEYDRLGVSVAEVVEILETLKRLR